MATRAYAYTAGSATEVTNFTITGDLLYENSIGAADRDLSIGNGPEGYDYRMGPDEATYNTIAFAGASIANPFPSGSSPSGTSNLTFFGALKSGNPDENFTILANYVAGLNLNGSLAGGYADALEAQQAINQSGTGFFTNAAFD